MAYFGFLRCGEFTCKSHIFDPLTDLSIQDIQLSKGNSQFTWQLKVSKTDPFRQGVSINYFSTGRVICPLQCMLALLHTRLTMGPSLVHRYAINRAHRCLESVFGSVF